jgi:hypothetical protein
MSSMPISMPSPGYGRPRRRRDRRVIPSAANGQQFLSDLREVNVAVDFKLTLAPQHDDQLVRRLAIILNVATGPEGMVENLPQTANWIDRWSFGGAEVLLPGRTGTPPVKPAFTGSFGGTELLLPERVMS